VRTSHKKGWTILSHPGKVVKSPRRRKKRYRTVQSTRILPRVGGDEIEVAGGRKD